MKIGGGLWPRPVHPQFTQANSEIALAGTRKSAIRECMKRMQHTGVHNPAESGQAMVEFALILPLLALMLFGIIQWGFIFNAYMTLRHSAHQVARTMSLPGADTSVQSARDIACSNIVPTLQCGNLGTPVVSSNSTVGGAAAVSVQLTYNLPLVIKFVVPNATSNALAIKASAIYRKE